MVGMQQLLVPKGNQSWFSKDFLEEKRRKLCFTTLTNLKQSLTKMGPNLTKKGETKKA